MAVTGVGSGTGTGVTSSAPPAKNLNGTVTKDEFLRLLVAQLKNQDPLDPVKDTEFASQLAQFSTLESIQQMNQNFKDLFLLQGLTQGTGLIGKSVTYKEDGATTTGKVDSLQVQNGSVALLIGGKTVSLSQVQNIA